ncbi:protein dispatched homolog 1-like [Mytilus edulis]|uniref:protein dispatched homolog 1-like n=1 Tax=Mytilus edulis TaxID=6550 RepID=UPI0039EF645E
MTKNDILRIKESEDGKKNELDNQNDNSGILQNNCEEKTEKETRKIKTKNLKRCSSTVQPLPLGENNESFTAENRKKEESKTPLKYCVFITNHPFLTFAVTLVLHTSIILVTILLMIQGHTVFPIEFEELPLILYTDVDRVKDLAWRDSMKYPFRVYRRIVGVTIPTWYNGEIGDTLEIIVEGNDVFSATYLELLSQTENRLFNFQDFQSDYCVINGQGTCEKPISVLRLFDGTYKDADPVFDSPSFVNASSVICKATQTNETKEFIQLVLQKDYDPCDLGKTSSKTRFFMFFGWPLVGYNDDQKLSDYQVQKLRPEIENIRDNLLDGHMDLYYMSIKLFEYDVKKQAFADMKLAIGSFAFIFVFMLFQTGSFWITSFGILSIITSFLLTNLIYRFAFKYEYFGFFHIISIFIILGIGADDVFIFYDTWRLSGNTEYTSKAHRLSDCYRKAAKTTFVTSLTTMAAFLVSAPSPLLPVSSFGLFSGMLVGVNYLFDLICFPVVILVYSEAIKPMFDKCVSFFPCCRSEDLKSERTISQESLIITHRRSRLYSKNIGMYNPDLPKFNKMFKRKMEINEEEESTSQTDETKEKKNFEDRNKVVLFLKNGFYDFMTRRSVKIIVPLVFFGTSIFFIYNATTLEPDSNQVEIYRSSHNYGKAYKNHYYGFQRNFEEEDTRIRLSWGVKPQNMDSCNLKSRDYCVGVTEWDESFDASSEEAQIALMNVCTRLENLTDSEISAYKIKRNPVTNEPEIACFMSALYKYYQKLASTVTSVNLTVPFPFTKSYVEMFMQYNSHIYDVSSLPADFDRHLEILISYWLTNGYTAIPTNDFWLYNPLIGEKKVSGVTRVYNNHPAYGMVYGTSLKVIGIEINTTMSYFTLGYPEGKPVHQLWENLINEEVEKMPDSLKSGFQSTYNTWHWIKVQETLVKSAILGLVVGITVAFPILALTTLNVVIGFLATVCIGLVTTIVVGIIPLAGWKLGILESLNLALVVGLSVDYVVHLAEAYRTSPYSTRDGRVKSMLESMGLSVLSGAITTFGAAIFLLFAQIKFLHEFGIFVMSTVGISLLFAFLFFTTFMALCGPEGDTGSIPALVKQIKAKCTKKKENDEKDKSKCSA